MVVITWLLEFVASVVGGADVGAGAVGGIVVPPPISSRLDGTGSLVAAIMAGYGYDKFAFLARFNVVLVGPLRHLLAAVFQSFGGIVVGIARGVLESVRLVSIFCHRRPCHGVLCYKVVGVFFADIDKITSYQAGVVVAIETHHFDVAGLFACWQGDAQTLWVSSSCSA